jgi:hypothetical protein
MLSVLRLVIKLQLNHGVRVVLLLVFQEFAVEVLTVLVKVPMETCVVEVVCSLQLNHGVDGIVRLASTKNVTLSFRLLLLQVFQRSFKLVVSKIEKILLEFLSQFYFQIISFLGHVIDGISELPLVVSDKVQEYNKTKQAVLFLRRSKLWGDVLKVSK